MIINNKTTGTSSSILVATRRFLHTTSTTRLLKSSIGSFQTTTILLDFPVTSTTTTTTTTKKTKQITKPQKRLSFIRRTLFLSLLINILIICPLSLLLLLLSVGTVQSFRVVPILNIDHHKYSRTTTGSHFKQQQQQSYPITISNRNSMTTLSVTGASIGSSTTLEQSSSIVNDVIPGRPTWQQTMIRIRDPKKSLEFYTNVLGMTLIDTFHFPQYKFSLYFVTTLPSTSVYTLIPGTQEAHDYLWNYEGVTIELTHNHGTEDDKENESTTSTFKGYHPGNCERDGFGHIAVNVNDVYVTCDKLINAGYTFKKKPNEGRMKGLAFVYDPDGYWIEIVQRGDVASKEYSANEMNFSLTMIRIKDPTKSLPFYYKFGMKLLYEKHFTDFSLYFLGSSNVNTSINYKDQFQPILELTHNHGTENDETFTHYNGNEDNKQGFGHLGFLVDNVYTACDALRDLGYKFRKEPDSGSMKGLAFVYDPDGYSIEIIKRGGIDYNDEKVVSNVT